MRQQVQRREQFSVPESGWEIQLWELVWTSRLGRWQTVLLFQRSLKEFWHLGQIAALKQWEAHRCLKSRRKKGLTEHSIGQLCDWASNCTGTAGVSKHGITFLKLAMKMVHLWDKNRFTSLWGWFYSSAIVARWLWNLLQHFKSLFWGAAPEGEVSTRGSCKLTSIAPQAQCWVLTQHKCWHAATWKTVSWWQWHVKGSGLHQWEGLDRFKWRNSNTHISG